MCTGTLLVGRPVRASAHRMPPSQPRPHVTRWPPARRFGKGAKSSTSHDPDETAQPRCAIAPVNMRGLKRGADRSESCRPGQIRLITLERQCPRQPGPDPAREGHSASPVPPRSPPAQTRKAPRRQGIRLPPPAAMIVPARHSALYRSQRRRDISAVGAAPLENRTHDGLARRLPHAPSPLRTQDGALSRRHQHCLGSHLLPQARRMRRPHNECEGAPLRLGDRTAEAEVMEVVRAGDSGPGAKWASGPHAADVRPQGRPNHQVRVTLPNASLGGMMLSLGAISRERQRGVCRSRTRVCPWAHGPAQLRTIFCACGPFCPWLTLKVTCSPSVSSR